MGPGDDMVLLTAFQPVQIPRYPRQQLIRCATLKTADQCALLRAQAQRFQLTTGLIKEVLHTMKVIRDGSKMTRAKPRDAP
jgi:hypothetical protein